MKIKKWQSPGLIYLLCLILIGCEKEGNPSLTNRESLLTSTRWILTSNKLNGTEMILDCAKDNTVIFYQNGTYKFDTGNLVCDESDFYDSDVDSGRWRLTNSGNILELMHDDPNYDSQAEIIELTATKLILRVQFDSGGTEASYNAIN